MEPPRPSHRPQDSPDPASARGDLVEPGDPADRQYGLTELAEAAGVSQQPFAPIE